MMGRPSWAHSRSPLTSVRTCPPCAVNFKYHICVDSQVMTNPITHLLWGYLIARGFSPKPQYLALGMLLGIVLDLDQIIPGVAHHGWMHTPVFAVALSGLMWAVTRNRLVFLISITVLMSHLVLDTVATQWGIMWLWPLSTHEFVIWTLDDLAILAVIKVYAFLVPAYWIWNNYKRTGESPMAVLEWIDQRIPRPVLYAGITTFGALMVFVWWDCYAWILMA